MQHAGVALLALLAASCDSLGPTGSAQPVTEGLSSQLRPFAFAVDVDLRTRAMAITPPLGPGLGLRVDARATSTAAPALSVVGADAVVLRVANFNAGPLGAIVPNRRRITFDVAIESRLPGIRLVTPTWPTPPARGVILIPVDHIATPSDGAVSGDGGNVITVTLPQRGVVTPSDDFDGTGAPGSGAPYNFFREAPCGVTGGAGCYRWKAYEPAIEPQSASSLQRVSFDVDPSVLQFRAWMLVAADVVPVAGAVSGRITR